MPTTDFFSGPGFEPEDVPVKKTSPAQQPVEKQPADDEPFAGMQKLDFDFLGGDDPAVPGETDPGDPFDDFSFQRPAAPAGPAQPARPAPFVFDEEPAPAPFSGVPETRITPAASASLGGTDDAPVRPVSPAQAAPKAAPFVFDFDDAPVERPASRTAASAAPSGEAVFDFGILEEKPAPAPAATPLDGYAPLSLDFLDDAEPIAAVPPAAPAAVKPVEPPRPAQPAPKAAPFVSISTMRLWSVPHPGRRRLQFLPERPRSISEFWKKSPPGPRRLLLPRHWMATRRCRWIFWTMQSLSPLCRPRLRRR